MTKIFDFLSSSVREIRDFTVSSASPMSVVVLQPRVRFAVSRDWCPLV